MKVKKLKYFPIILLMLMFFFNSLFSNSQTTNSSYTVLQKIGKVELREYKPLLFVSYQNNNGTNNQNSSFRVLADYIFGANEKNEKIAMTSPVVINLNNNREMSFRIPKKYNKKTIPKPKNDEIQIVSKEKIIKATIRYSGYTSEQKEDKMIEQLKKTLLENDITHTNKFELFVYDPPYKPFNRRNEISVNIIN